MFEPKTSWLSSSTFIQWMHFKFTPDRAKLKYESSIDKLSYEPKSKAFIQYVQYVMENEESKTCFMQCVCIISYEMRLNNHRSIYSLDRDRSYFHLFRDEEGQSAPTKRIKAPSTNESSSVAHQHMLLLPLSHSFSSPLVSSSQDEGYAVLHSIGLDHIFSSLRAST